MALVIRAPKTTKAVAVRSISSYTSEEEVILARGTTYIIRKATKTSAGRWVLNVDIIEQLPVPVEAITGGY